MVNQSFDRFLERQLETLGLSTNQRVRGHLLWMSEELLRWNQHVNLTAITVLEDVIEKHIVDSLVVTPMFSGHERVLDVGSGGGFPGLPLKIVFDDLFLVSVDAVAKKINFQRHIVRKLGLNRCLMLHSRVEDVPQWEGFGLGFDVIISRAFAALDDFVRLALPCLTTGGRLIAMKGPEGEKELSHASPLIAGLGVECVKMERKQLPNSGAERVLITLKKTR